MIPRGVFVTILWLCFVLNVGAQQSGTPQAYHDYDAYQIYVLLLPQAEASEKHSLVIEEQTSAKLQQPDGFPSGPEACVDASVAGDFQEAIADYNRVNQQRWLLQRDFQIERPYVIASSDALKGFSKADWWGDFYKHYPNSGGFQEMSAVGFNKERTRAIVYSGASCGKLCGDWSFHLFKKVEGAWKQVPGVNCHTVS